MGSPGIRRKREQERDLLPQLSLCQVTTPTEADASNKYLKMTFPAGLSLQVLSDNSSSAVTPLTCKRSLCKESLPYYPNLNVLSLSNVCFWAIYRDFFYPFNKYSCKSTILDTVPVTGDTEVKKKKRWSPCTGVIYTLDPMLCLTQCRHPSKWINILFSLKRFLSHESKALSTGYTKSLLTTYGKCASRDHGWGVGHTRQWEPCASAQLYGFESKSTYFRLIKSSL